jgi:hypothetical protein
MPTSYATDILPLFSDDDITCMAQQGVSLDDYAYISDPGKSFGYDDHGNARRVYAYLTGTSQPRMPPDANRWWTAAQLNVYATWMSDGFLP